MWITGRLSSEVLVHTLSFLKSLELSAYFCWLMVIAIMHGEDRSNQSNPFTFPFYTQLLAGPPVAVSEGVRYSYPTGPSSWAVIFILFGWLVLHWTLNLELWHGDRKGFELRIQWLCQCISEGIICGSILVLSSCVVMIAAQGCLELKFWLIAQSPRVLINTWCLRCILRLRRWLSKVLADKHEDLN